MRKYANPMVFVCERRLCVMAFRWGIRAVRITYSFIKSVTRHCSLTDANLSAHVFELSPKLTSRHRHRFAAATAARDD